MFRAPFLNGDPPVKPEKAQKVDFKGRANRPAERKQPVTGIPPERRLRSADAGFPQVLLMFLISGGVIVVAVGVMAEVEIRRI